MEMLTKKKDKTVILLESGKIRIKLSKLAHIEFCQIVEESALFYNSLPWKYLDLQNFQTRASILLLAETAKKLRASNVKITFTSSEANFLWGIITQQDLPMELYPSFRELLMKLHQKLINNQL